jgi:hypothetical protein
MLRTRRLAVIALPVAALGGYVGVLRPFCPNLAAQRVFWAGRP